MIIAKIGNKTYKFKNYDDYVSTLDIMNKLQETLEEKMVENNITVILENYPYCDGANNCE